MSKARTGWLRAALDRSEPTVDPMDQADNVVEIMDPQRIMSELRSLSNRLVQVETEGMRLLDRKEQLQRALIEAMKDYGIKGEIVT